MNAPANLAVPAEADSPAFLGLRSPIERAAEVERLCRSPETRAWWRQSEREKDAERLRKRLTDRFVALPHVNSREMGRAWSPDFQARQQQMHLRIDAVCRWAMERMRRADAAWMLGDGKTASARHAERMAELIGKTPVRGEV